MPMGQCCWQASRATRWPRSSSVTMASWASRFGTALYLAPFRRWPPHHRAGMRYARGRVLDIGSGAGRVALHLQGRGQEVIAIDNSPGAIEACRRGVRDARLLSIDEVDGSLGLFDTIVMYGNNFRPLCQCEKGETASPPLSPSHLGARTDP